MSKKRASIGSASAVSALPEALTVGVNAVNVRPFAITVGNYSNHLII